MHKSCVHAAQAATRTSFNNRQPCGPPGRADAYYALFLVAAVPDLDAPVGAAGDVEARVEEVPGHLVDGHVVRVVRVEEGARVRLRADVHLALLRAD